MKLAELVIKSHDMTLTREERAEFYRQAVSMAESEIKKTPRKVKDDTPEGFDRFWSTYPHKIAKLSAIKAFEKALKLTDIETIIRGVNWYARNKPDETAWAHPASWLNAGRWEDGQAETVLTESLNILLGEPDWKRKLSNAIGVTQTNMWFKEAKLDGSDLYVLAKNYQWITERYLGEIKLILPDVTLCKLA